MEMVKVDEKTREQHKVMEDIKNKALKFEGKAKILSDEVSILRNRNKSM